MTTNYELRDIRFVAAPTGWTLWHVTMDGSLTEQPLAGWFERQHFRDGVAVGRIEMVAASRSSDALEATHPTDPDEGDGCSECHGFPWLCGWLMRGPDEGWESLNKRFEEWREQARRHVDWRARHAAALAAGGYTTEVTS